MSRFCYIIIQKELSLNNEIISFNLDKQYENRICTD